MTIRQACEAELERILDMYDAMHAVLTGEYGYPFALERERNAEFMRAQIKSKMARVLVAEAAGGELVGFLHGTISRGDRRYTLGGESTAGRVEAVYAEEGARGTGAADALMDAAEQWFRAEGVTIAEAYIVRGNERSTRFHARHGFEEIATRVVKQIK